MNPDKQRTAIAEYCGWKEIGKSGIYQNVSKGVNGCMPNGEVHKKRIKMKLPGANSFLVPDYLNDLNAMHEAEKALEDKDEGGRLMAEYAIWKLPSVCEIYSRKNELVHPYTGSIGNYLLIHATAAERAEAFLRTIRQWEE